MTTPTGDVPTEFPGGSPLDLAAIPRTQVETAIRFNAEAQEALRQKYGEALAEASVEYQVMEALKAAAPLLQALMAAAL